jgi:hypothetical protein
MTSALDITKFVKPPRSVFLNFPLGHQTGKPHQPALQRQVLLDAFAALPNMTAPGAIHHLPYVWDESDTSWESTDFLPGYLPPYTRSETPLPDY